MTLKFHPPGQNTNNRSCLFREEVFLPRLCDDTLLCPTDVVLPVPIVDEADRGDGAGPPLVQLLRPLLKLGELGLQLLFQLGVPLVLSLTITMVVMMLKLDK